MPTPLINKQNVRKYLLDRAAVKRPGWNCRRVSAQALEEINATLQAMLDRLVHSHPTVGQTFKVVQLM